MADSTINYGIPYPTGGDAVVVHTDVEKLAKSVDATALQTNLRVDQAFTDIEDARYDLTASPTGAGANIDTIENGVYSVWSGPTAEAMGLPTATLGTFTSTRYGTGAGSQVWIPRVLQGAQIWVRSEFTGGWGGWSQIGAGAGDNAPMLRTAPGSGFKTAPLALTLGYGGASTTGTGTTVVIQHMPKASRRVQLHLRNWNPRYVNADSPPATITATAIGLHNGSGGSAAWTALPNTSGVTSVTDGDTEYTSGWIDVPEAWRGKDIAVRYTWSSTGAVQRNIGTGWTNGSKDNTPPLFAWLEIEVPSSTPVVAAFGDSLSSGVSSARPVVDSWIDQWARANDAVPAHWSHSGDKAVGWTAATVRKWGLYGWDIAAPDAMIYLMGSNDLAEPSITLTEMQARIGSTVDLIRGMITPNLYAGTILPRTNQATGSTYETVRRQVNTWIPRSGLFRQAYATAAAISTDDDTILPAYDADGIHLNTAGYGAVAGAVTPSPVGAAGSSSVTYMGDGVYEIS